MKGIDSLDFESLLSLSALRNRHKNQNQKIK